MISKTLEVLRTVTLKWEGLAKPQTSIPVIPPYELVDQVHGLWCPKTQNKDQEHSGRLDARLPIRICFQYQQYGQHCAAENAVGLRPNRRSA